jgi:hypothetical protein
MDLLVKSPPGRPPIWDHFLMRETQVTVRLGVGGAVNEMPMQFAGGVFRATIPADAITVDLSIQTRLRQNGKTYSLLTIIQRFQVRADAGQVTGLTAGYWQKIVPGQAMGLAKTVPPLHPLLAQDGNTITVSLEFVDITELFNDLHGDTPWFSILDLLAGTQRTIRVLAALRGHPFVWYVVIAAAAAGQKAMQPNLLYYPADYGGITYLPDRMEGLSTPNHDTSVGNIQCGGETLFSFLTRPLADADYKTRIARYLQLTARFKNRPGRKPPALHHFREALSYTASGGKLVPNYWEVPFGFENAIQRHRQLLLIPQVNGADAGFAKREGLKSIAESAINTIYTNSNILTYETLEFQKLILTCYSQSGGNVFTAARANLKDIRALVCFEPQYMNAYLKGEDKSLALGKDVIPLLLRDGQKVAIIARRRQGWDRKYLPERVSPGDLILLPDDRNYTLLDYPDPSRPYDPFRSPVLARRYSRLLKPKSDPVLDEILGGDSANVDLASAQEEAKVEDIIAAMRKRGLNDEQMVKAVFTSDFNVDDSGGYFTHNFIVASGQPKSDGSTLNFFDLALSQIG